jgi:serine protease
MTKKLLFASLVFFLQMSVVGFSQSTANHVPGQFLVQLKPGQNMGDFLQKYKVLNTPGENLNLLQTPAPRWNIFLLGSDLIGQENYLLDWLKAKPEVQLAQLNHYVQDRFTEPDDPNYTNGDMWDMHNTGQNSGLADADIDAPEAWTLSTGGLTAAGDTIVVAVIDGGFRLTHSDINFWKNRFEIPGNSIDDDNNGYVDDYDGWDASFNDNNPQSTTNSTNNHGTHVAGTVGAIGNNNLGVVGVNWDVKIMPIRGSSGNEAIVVAAYSYAAEMRRRYNQSNGLDGAFVVATNSSFGVDNGQQVNFPLWAAMYDSMGVLGILSAGATANANNNIDVTGDIPTGCPSDYLISVTNTTRTDTKATSAGYGLTTIDLGAPGSTITSCTSSSNTSVGALSGTSMATPHVAGAIALMLSYACPQMIDDYKMYPDSIAKIFKQYLLQSTDPITALDNISVTGGRLNINNALLELANYPCLPATANSSKQNLIGIGSLTLSPNPASDFVNLKYIAPFDAKIVAVITDVAGRQVQQIDLGNRHQGNHAHNLNISGLEAGVYFIQLTQNQNSLGSAKLIRN